MKNTKQDRTWYLENGFEIRKINDHWYVFECGEQISGPKTLEKARIYAKDARESRDHVKA